MTSRCSLTVDERDGGQTRLAVSVERLLNWGFTGRDEAAVRAHVEELEAEGITAPEEIPTAYPKPNHLLTTAASFEAPSPDTSGEAEFVLFPTDEETFVGVGSDHTDRALEEVSILLSKSVCPNVVSETVWRYSDVADHWDQLELASYTAREGAGADRSPYQEATLESIKPPDELLELTDERSSEPVDGTVIFSGSVGTETDSLVKSDYFEAVLYDPVLDRSLTAAYEIRQLDWID